MTIKQPPDATAQELLSSARELAWSDDESSAADAYDCAISAVEQAFRSIATPDNPTDDLGVILKHWQDRPDLWCEGYSSVLDIDTVMPVLADLWERRPEADEAFPVHLEDARTALVIAEWTLKLFDLGFIELLDELTPEEEAHDLALAEQRSNEYESGQMETVPWEEVRERLDARWRNE